MIETDEVRIENAIKKRHADASGFQFFKTGGPLAGGVGYYVTFESEQVDEDENYYYAFVDKVECRLFDDGWELVNAVQVLTEKRKSLLERVSDFNFPDLVGGVIAVLITISLVFLILYKGSSEGVSKEFLAIFTLILGYYFGRGRPGSGSQA